VLPGLVDLEFLLLHEASSGLPTALGLQVGSQEVAARDLT
jgi:hypothetical protein